MAGGTIWSKLLYICDLDLKAKVIHPHENADKTALNCVNRFFAVFLS